MHSVNDASSGRMARRSDGMCGRKASYRSHFCRYLTPNVAWARTGGEMGLGEVGQALPGCDLRAETGDGTTGVLVSANSHRGQQVPGEMEVVAAEEARDLEGREECYCAVLQHSWCCVGNHQL